LGVVSSPPSARLRCAPPASTTSQVGRPASAASGRAPAGAKPSCVDASPTARAAAAVAAACGRRVEVLAKRSEFSQVFTNPDGTSTLETSLVPKRVKQGTQWVPVDTTLRKAAGGIAPRASALPMVFSGGGRGPLAQLTNHGRELSV